MSNFAFLQPVNWPEMHADCARAESYVTNDPRSACFYSRRTVELLVDYLYDVLALPVPYKNDLAAKINDPKFKSKVGIGIATKLNLIRKLGNTAVHDAQPIPPRAALDVLRELHHVMLWAAFRYSTDPQAVPMKAAFDPKIAAKAAPLTRQEVAQLAAKFAAQDEAHAKVLAEKDELAAQKDAEIAALREAVKQAQAANQQPDDRDYDEADTRDRFIDVMLAEAGWPLTDTEDREYPVTGMPNGEARGSSTTSCGVQTVSRWRSSRQNGRPKARRSANSRPSCTRTAWRGRQGVGRSSSTPTVLSTGSGMTPAATLRGRSRVSTPGTSWNF